jgi:hypothetical protein
LEGAGVGFNGQACGITTQKKPLDRPIMKNAIIWYFFPRTKTAAHTRTHAEDYYRDVEKDSSLRGGERPFLYFSVETNKWPSTGKHGTRHMFDLGI